MNGLWDCHRPGHQQPQQHQAGADCKQALGSNAFGQPGRFQFEAAIQAVHADRRKSGRTDWEAVALLYEGLFGAAPTTGVAVARAAAVAEAHGAATALALLEGLSPDAVVGYQPYWVLRAHLGMDRTDAVARALALTDDPARRDFILRRYAQ